jgi:hypothetical protein
MGTVLMLPEQKNRPHASHKVPYPIRVKALFCVIGHFLHFKTRLFQAEQASVSYNKMILTELVRFSE